MLLVVLGMVMLVPLLAWPSIPGLQTLADRAILVMAALLAGILVLRARLDFTHAELLHFLRTGPNTAILLYYVYSLLQVAFGLRNPALRHAGAFELERILTGGLLYFALAYHIRRSEHLAKIRDALVLVTGVMAVIGIVALVAQGMGSRAILSGNSPFFGAFLMILFPIPLIQALTERDARRQNVAQVVAILAGVCLLLSGTGTSTTWLGALGSIALLGLLGRIGLPARQSALVNRRKYLLPLLVMLVCGVVYMALGGPGRLLSGLPSAEQQEQSSIYRRKKLYAAELLFLRKPLFGHGLGTYPILQETYNGNGRSAHDVEQNGPTLEEMAHSFWLQMAAEQGLVGVGLFLAIVVSFLAAGVRRLHFMEAGLRRWLLLACLAGMGGFVIDALGNSVWQFAQVSMFFWLILGLGMACLRPRTAR
jgi:O-antigen ligase